MNHVGPLDADKLAEADFLYVFNIGFLASLLGKASCRCFGVVLESLVKQSFVFAVKQDFYSIAAQSTVHIVDQDIVGGEKLSAVLAVKLGEYSKETLLNMSSSSSL